eukprot:CAMPEP_0181217350 /NCGR_PEP_ID=MMETSP1096-20121128/27104_1 /TAXON_ID=156174 ORGANISM="Chrysochromulina ericina, Strain CCMP281" /NCGR_SAMPLE_ID=MMETSP1096 /ASSEMBLY_ACC=CAM_ASM_000453 /LENGTH=38 /DNA_ID= /DNA_START= /DNA_END= /DNA_ORIENTATION=
MAASILHNQSRERRECPQTRALGRDPQIPAKPKAWSMR